MVQIVERASIDQCAATDESPHHMGSEDAVILASQTAHTTMLNVALHMDAPTLESARLDDRACNARYGVSAIRDSSPDAQCT